MAKGVYKVHQLAEQIANTLRDYSTVKQEQVNEIAAEVAKRGAKKLKLKTTGTFNDLTGAYRKGWRAKKEDGIWIVHNATDYQLTHLLEKGHAKANGGRTRAFPHIKEIEQEIIEEFEKEIFEVFSNG